jgi:hypothetical protein
MESPDWLTSLNTDQQARHRAALAEWYDVYNPHIADATAMHREQIIFDIAKVPTFREETAFIVAALAPIIHEDAMRILCGQLGVVPRAGIVPLFMNHDHLMHAIHSYDVDEAVWELMVTGHTDLTNINILMSDARLRPRHVRDCILHSSHLREATRRVLSGIACNPFCDSTQARSEMGKLICAHRKETRKTLDAVHVAIPLEPLVRMIAAYLWKQHVPAALDV